MGLKEILINNTCNNPNKWIEASKKPAADPSPIGNMSSQPYSKLSGKKEHNENPMMKVDIVTSHILAVYSNPMKANSPAIAIPPFTTSVFLYRCVLLR